MENLTEVVFILDKSGSMAGLEDDTIGGFNSTIEDQKTVEGNVIVSTVFFNNLSKVIHDRVPLSEVKPLTRDDYKVGGMTALLDALGDAIKHIRNVHKYAREEDKPDKTVFFITTDGIENSSHKFSFDEIKKLLEEQKAQDWDFVFFGANIDTVAVTGRMGIDPRRAVSYRSDERGTEVVYRSMSRYLRMPRLRKKLTDMLHDSPSVDDDSWREEVDKDFASREQGGTPNEGRTPDGDKAPDEK